MAEKPIMFSGEMVRAILEGRKTQTRRVIKPTAKGCTVGVYTCKGEATEAINTQDDGDPWDDVRCPYGQPGDTLWVRETWVELFDHHRDYPNIRQCAYRADCGAEGDRTRKEYGYKWKPSIHMPRKFARIFLTVKDVRVERVQDITWMDALKEGIEDDPGKTGGTRWFKRYDIGEYTTVDPCKSFMTLWNSINEKRGLGWETNPWVWVIEFELKETKGE
jgi:hypothetical protein